MEEWWNQKVSAREWLRNKLLGTKGPDGKRQSSDLEQIGTRIIVDDRFDDRRREFNNFLEYIKECSEVNYEKSTEDIVESTASQVFEINNKLHQSAVPFGRAGDERKNWYSDMISNWNSLHTRFMLPLINSTRSILNRMNESGRYKPEIQKMQAVQRLRHFFEAYYLDCALTVASLSWFGEDVTGQWMGAIQTMPSPRGYPPSSSDMPLPAGDALRGPQLQKGWDKNIKNSDSHKYGGNLNDERETSEQA